MKELTEIKAIVIKLKEIWTTSFQVLQEDGNIFTWC